METSKSVMPSKTLKSILRKLVLTALALFLAFRTYNLMVNLLTKPNQSFNSLENVFLAFLLNVFLTGVFAFSGFAWPTENLLSKNYYQTGNIKLINQTYRLLKVEWFRKALMLFFWGQKKNRAKFFNGKKTGINALIKQTEKAEFGHLASFMAINTALISCAIKGYHELFAIGIFINIIGNFYPIILQRKHRARISRIVN